MKIDSVRLVVVVVLRETIVEIAEVIVSVDRSGVAVSVTKAVVVVYSSSQHRARPLEFESRQIQ